MTEKPEQDGYVRTAFLHQALEWEFEPLSLRPLLAVVTLRTSEGAIQVGMSEPEMRSLLRNLTLFLDKPSKVPS